MLSFYLENLPPFVLAFISIIYVFAWQLGGSHLIYRIFSKSNFSMKVNFCLTWLSFPCFAGAFIVLSSFFKILSIELLIIVQVFILVLGLKEISKFTIKKKYYENLKKTIITI